MLLPGFRPAHPLDRDRHQRRCIRKRRTSFARANPKTAPERHLCHQNCLRERFCEGSACDVAISELWRETEVLILLGAQSGEDATSSACLTGCFAGPQRDSPKQSLRLVHGLSTLTMTRWGCSTGSTAGCYRIPKRADLRRLGATTCNAELPSALQITVP